MKSFLFIFLSCMIVGCGKEEEEPVDYRDKYIGDYNFIIHRSWWRATPSHTFSGDTTYSEIGSIEKGSDKNAVLISLPSHSLRPTMYYDGTLEEKGWPVSGQGKFSSTTELTYSWTYFTPSGSTTFNMTGNKK